MNTTQKGDIVEQKVILFFLEHNIPIAKPIGNNLPYDLIIDFNGNLYKIQIKAGYKGKAEETFIFNTRSTSKNYTEITNKNYLGKIDNFITYYEDLPEMFFIIPIDKAAAGSMILSYAKHPKSGQNSAFKYNLKDFLNIE